MDDNSSVGTGGRAQVGPQRAEKTKGTKTAKPPLFSESIYEDENTYAEATKMALIASDAQKDPLVLLWSFRK